MRPTFLITSAINTNVGAYTPLLRIYQTHDTINSIQKYYPDAMIVLVDGGKEITEPDLKAQWENLGKRCNMFLNMAPNEQIQHLHTKFLDNITQKNEMGGTTGLIKSVAELTLMASFLDALKNDPQLEPIKKTDRIFKISGRYQLSPFFDKDVYENAGAKNKYIFRKRDASWMNDAKEAVGTEFGFASRLWSFDINQLDDVVDRFNTMIEDCLKISATHYVDIEHLLYKHFIDADPLEIDHTHLMGTIAPTGSVIYD